MNKNTIYYVILFFFYVSYVSSNIVVDKELYVNKCAFDIINNNIYKDLTVIDATSDSKYLKVLQESLKFKIILRSFLALSNNIPNQAYVLITNDTDLEAELQELVRDSYWNPGADIIVILPTLISRQNIFQKFHKLNAFKVILISNQNDIVDIYDFEFGDRCNFAPEAIKRYYCTELITHNTIIRKVLEERDPMPYSECQMRLIVNVREPYTFGPSQETKRSIGFEETFVSLYERNMKFKHLKIDYSLIRYIGAISENFSASGNLGKIQNEEYDGVMGGLLLSNQRYRAFDITYPHIFDDFLLITPKATEKEKWILMITVFGGSVWILIWISFLTINIYGYLCNVFNEKKNTIIGTVYKMSVYFIGHGYRIRRKDIVKFVMLTWAFYTWLVNCFYQSDLTSVFTKAVYYKQIDSLSDMLQLHYELFIPETTYLFTQTTNEYEIGIKDAHVRNTLSDCLRELAVGGKKFTIGSRLIYRYLMPEFHDKYGNPRLHEIKTPYLKLYTTSYFKKGNPNLKRIRQLEQLLIETGVPSKIESDLIYANRLKFKFENENPAPLSLSDLQGLYLLYIIGCALSVTLLICELLYKVYQN